MRCDIHTSRSITKDGKCQRIFCVERRQPGCALLKYGKALFEKLRAATEERAELEKELIV